MRQRVGFARALVVEPDALLMDEPFSALDVLTAQNLRAELLRLWTQTDFPTKAMLIVTHNIEEAVILADRIFVLGANPGRIRSEIPVQVPPARATGTTRASRPWSTRSTGFMTGRDSRPPSHVWTVAAPGEGSPGRHAAPGGDRRRHGRPARDPGSAGRSRGSAQAGPRADVRGRRPAPAGRRRAAAGSGRAWRMPTCRSPTTAGCSSAADITESKEIFARRARERAPLVRSICNALDDDQGRQPRARTSSSTCSAAASPRTRRRRAAAHRGRLGTLRRAVRLRRQYGPAHAGPTTGQAAVSSVTGVGRLTIPCVPRRAARDYGDGGA